MRVTQRETFRGRLGARVAAAWRSRLLRSSTGVGVLTGVELVLGLLTAILLARGLGIEGLGIYSLLLAAVILAGLPVEAGLPNLVKREIAHSGVDPESGVAKGVMVFATTVIVLMSAVILPLALVYGDTLAPGLDGTERSILPITVLLIPVSALCNTLGGALAGMQLVVIGVMPQKLVRPGIFAIALGIASMVEPGWLTPMRAMALQLAAAAAALAFAGFCFARHFSHMLRRRSARILWRTWITAMFRLGLSSGLLLARGQVLLLVTGVLSSIEDVALLRIAQRGVGLITLGTTIAVIAAAPRVARLNAEGRHDHLQHLLTQVARVGFGVALIGLICFVFGGHWLLAAIFGSGFVAAWSTLIILALTEAVRTLLGPGVMLLNMVRHEGVTTLGFAISLALSTLIAAVLIPMFGIVGAACGTFVGVTSMSVFIRNKARRNLRLDPAAFGGQIHRNKSRGQS